MKTHYMKENALAYFKNNTEENASLYLEADSSLLIAKFNENALEESAYELPDGFKLDMSEEVSKSDCKNVRLLYSALSKLSDTKAADERFWAGLAHSEFWDYMKYRCKLENNDKLSDKIKRNYFFSHGSKRSLLVHPLARLWLVGRLIYDPEKNDHFEALKFLEIDFPTKVLSLFSSNFTNNPIIARAVLNALAYIDSEISKISRKNFLATIRYVNLLGGTAILDYFSENELKEKIITHYKNTCK